MEYAQNNLNAARGIQGMWYLSTGTSAECMKVLCIQKWEVSFV